MGRNVTDDIARKMSEAGNGQPVMREKNSAPKSEPPNDVVRREDRRRLNPDVSEMGRKMSEAGMGSPPMRQQK